MIGVALVKPSPLNNMLLRGITSMLVGLLIVTRPESALSVKLSPPVALFSICGP